ncbi:MAG: OmpA family protein [Sphingobacteriaceae bacterium]
MINKLLFAAFLFFPLLMKAQQRQYTTTDKQAIKQYALAGKNIGLRLYDEAISLLSEAVTLDSKFLEAHNQLADLLRLRQDYEGAAVHYKQILVENPRFNRAIYLNLGDIQVSLANYAEAQNNLQMYLEYEGITAEKRRYASKLLKDCAFSLIAIKNPVAFKPISVGEGINTENDEYLPVVTADESTLIFTRKVCNNEDFYVSKKHHNQWTTAINLSKNINTADYNEGAQSISQDGQYLFFTGCNRPDGLGRCDIYISKKNVNDWGKPTNVGLPVNTSGWESQPAISADGRALYFVSNRQGGYGGYDIWKSELLANGWGTPENLGPNINTPYDEQSPFIHPDDQTLYFSSNGWPGMGNKDLFISRKSFKGLWQKPVNLGFPINSNGEENGLSLTATGNYAFFSSNKLSGSGGYDIYTFELPVNIRPSMVTYVSGTVSDAKTNEPIDAEIEIIDLNNGMAVYIDSSTPDSGRFLATLSVGKNYGLNISKEGYLFSSENFSLLAHEATQPFNIIVALQPVEIGNKVILKNIFFETNEFSLKAESKSALMKLIDFMTKNPKISIEISGYTDDVGNEKLNQTLSENRAKSVYDYVVKNGIESSRLSFIGYGKNQPITTNANELGRQQNRRTEFKITQK